MPRKLVYFLIVATFTFGAASFGQAQGKPGDKSATPSAVAPKGFLVHFRQAIAALSDADADKPQKMFNRQPRSAALSSWSPGTWASTSVNPSPTRA